MHKFWDLASRADRYFRHHRPDAVVLIDYPGLQLVDRPAGQGARHSRVLLRRAADLGLGRLADQEDAAVRRPRAVQAAVRGGLVSRARLQRDVRRPSVFRSAARRDSSMRRSSQQQRSRRRAARGDPARLADAGSEEQLRLLPEGGASSCTRACRTRGSPSRRSSRARPRWSAKQLRGVRLADRGPRRPHAGADRTPPTARWRCPARCRSSCCITRSRR